MVYQLDEYRLKFAAIDRSAPPRCIEAEESVLGACLVDPRVIDRISDFLKPEMFYITAHQKIYKALLAMQREDDPIDLMSVTIRLNDLGILSEVGGKSRLAQLHESVIGSVNADLHAQLVAEKYQRRSLIQLAQDISVLAWDVTKDWSEVLSQAETGIFGLTDSAKQKGLAPLSEVLCEEMARLERVAREGRSVGYATGFYDLDAMTLGLKPQTLTIIAGRPSMGKSAFAANVARNIASKGFPVAIFSLEMSGGEIASRLLSAETKIEGSRLLSGQIAEKEWGTVSEEICKLSEMPVYIDESQSVTPSHILSQCRLLQSRTGAIGAVIVDYLHLMLDGDEDEVRELGRLTRAFKKMSRQLNAPIVVLSQLSRAVESRQNKRPMMSDLRQSGAIEQDADLILMLYRDEYYNPDTPDRGIAEVIVAKQRSGAVGTVKLLFEPWFSCFKNLARR